MEAPAMNHTWGKLQGMNLKAPALKMPVSWAFNPWAFNPWAFNPWAFNPWGRRPRCLMQEVYSITASTWAAALGRRSSRTAGRVMRLTISMTRKASL